MHPDIRPGGIFPDYALPDQLGAMRTLSELQGGDPLILTVARGNYCPEEHRQHLKLMTCGGTCAPPPPRSARTGTWPPGIAPGLRLLQVPRLEPPLPRIGPAIVCMTNPLFWCCPPPSPYWGPCRAGPS